MVVWWIWLVMGFAVLVMFFAEMRGNAKTSLGSQAAEIERLQGKLDTSTAKIETLVARLNAVETIVTDEEHQLRREFKKLRMKPNRRKS